MTIFSKGGVFKQTFPNRPPVIEAPPQGSASENECNKPNRNQVVSHAETTHNEPLSANNSWSACEIG